MTTVVVSSIRTFAASINDLRSPLAGRSLRSTPVSGTPLYQVIRAVESGPGGGPTHAAISRRNRHDARVTIDPDAAANYLLDLGPLVLERATQAKTATGSQDAFEKGRAFGLAEVVGLMQQQAAAFQIDLAALGLDGVDAERDLL